MTRRRTAGAVRGLLGPRADVIPVSERLLVLQLLRVLGAAAVLAIPGLTEALNLHLFPLVLSYLLFIGAVELARHRLPERAGSLMSWTVLVDGTFLALAVAITGGYRSPLLFLVFLDVMAVTLLASYGAGLKVALWCATLLLLCHAAATAGLLNAGPVVGDRVAGVSALAFLLFALSTAMLSSLNERALRHSRAQLESLVALGTELGRARHADDVVSALVRHARARLGFSRVVVLARRGDRWAGACDEGGGQTFIDIGDLSGPIVWDTWATGAPALVRSLDDDLLDSALPAACNVVVAPVVADDEPLGVVAAEWGDGTDGRIPTTTVQALAQSATHAALSLRNAELLDDVERLATRDALTGLANRRLFDESLQREAARSERMLTPLSLLIVDVDDFKVVNDTYGHPAGDGVLREVARCIVANTKGFDLVARYGGDEFVVLLPDCSEADAVGVAERLRRAIADGVQGASVTVSAGIATIPHNALGSERLVAAADAALYDAKRSGRDQARASSRAPDEDGVLILP